MLHNVQLQVGWRRMPPRSRRRPKKRADPKTSPLEVIWERMP